MEYDGFCLDPNIQEGSADTDICTLLLCSLFGLFFLPLCARDLLLEMPKYSFGGAKMGEIGFENVRKMRHENRCLLCRKGPITQPLFYEKCS